MPLAANITAPEKAVPARKPLKRRLAVARCNAQWF